MEIAVVGTTFLDIKGFSIDSYSPTGRNAGIVKFIPGGVGRNIAEDLANIHMNPVFLSLVNDDAQGAEIKNQLQNCGVDTRYIRSTANGMGTWVAVFDDSGELAGSVSNRPDLTELKHMIDEQGTEMLSSCDSIVLEMDIEESVVESVLRIAEKLGKPVYGVIGNMTIACRRRDLLEELDGFVCNASEAGQLFPELTERSTPENMSFNLREKIRNTSIKSMVVTLGKHGAVYAKKSGESGCCPAERVMVKDTTGAGDAFCAGFAAAMTQGLDIGEAVRVGSKVASSAITSDKNTCAKLLWEELCVPNFDK